MLKVEGFCGGILVSYRGFNILLDPSTPPVVKDSPRDYAVFISHAHTDHSRGLGFEKFNRYATPETISLRRVRRYKARLLEAVGYGETVELPYGVNVEILNAGHILGSAMFKIETPESTVLYTGDFNTERGFTVEPAEPVECDVAIVESTYGSPAFIFPPRGKIYMDLLVWATKTLEDGETPLIQTDILGNSQELNALFNRFTRLKVYVHPRTARYSRIYETYGYSLRYEYWKPRSLDGVYIAPKGFTPGTPGFRIGFASGWATRFSGSRFPIPFSDHADFKAIVNYIAEVKPKKAYTFHGGIYNRILAKHLSTQLEVEAEPLP